MDRARSLHIEHVSPAGLMRAGRFRAPPPLAGASCGGRRATLALLRRWFFARKPDAGFVLTDFPATLLQAKVFDEWLDARDEAIDAAIAVPRRPAAPSPRITARSAFWPSARVRVMIPIKNPDGDRPDARVVRRRRGGLGQAEGRAFGPGITTYDLDQAGRELIAAHGARSADYGYQHNSPPLSGATSASRSTRRSSTASARSSACCATATSSRWT